MECLIFNPYQTCYGISSFLFKFLEDCSFVGEVAFLLLSSCSSALQQVLPATSPLLYAEYLAPTLRLLPTVISSQVHQSGPALLQEYQLLGMLVMPRWPELGKRHCAKWKHVPWWACALCSWQWWCVLLHGGGKWLSSVKSLCVE